MLSIWIITNRINKISKKSNKAPYLKPINTKSNKKDNEMKITKPIPDKLNKPSTSENRIKKSESSQKLIQYENDITKDKGDKITEIIPKKINSAVRKDKTNDLEKQSYDDYKIRQSLTKKQEKLNIDCSQDFVKESNDISCSKEEYTKPKTDNKRLKQFQEELKRLNLHQCFKKLVDNGFEDIDSFMGLYS